MYISKNDIIGLCCAVLIGIVLIFPILDGFDKECKFDDNIRKEWVK